ncbi:hypothetical protein Dimus_028274 [Dionaea muscipula]
MPVLILQFGTLSSCYGNNPPSLGSICVGRDEESVIQSSNHTWKVVLYPVFFNLDCHPLEIGRLSCGSSASYVSSFVACFLDDRIGYVNTPTQIQDHALGWLNQE